MSNTTMPPGWDKTHEDLMNEMMSGTRPSIGRAERDWATQYEQSLLPPDLRFPKVGEIYEAVRDIDVQLEIYFSAPFTNSGNVKLLNGERVRITFISPEDKPIVALAHPIQYSTIEERFMPRAQREPPYSHFSVVLKTAGLHAGFRPVSKWSIRNLTLIAADICRRS